MSSAAVPTSSVPTGSDTHNESSGFDQLILSRVEADPLSITMAPYLLATIAECAPDRLDGGYRDIHEARKLIAARSELYDYLKTAWKARSFVPILDLRKSSLLSVVLRQI